MLFDAKSICNKFQDFFIIYFVHMLQKLWPLSTIIITHHIFFFHQSISFINLGACKVLKLPSGNNRHTV